MDSDLVIPKLPTNNDTLRGKPPIDLPMPLLLPERRQSRRRGGEVTSCKGKTVRILMDLLLMHQELP